MTRGLATAMTLLLASVSGLAIWRTDAGRRAPAGALVAVPAAPELAAPVAAPGTAASGPAAPSTSSPLGFRDLLERWLDRELVVELRRDPSAVTLRVALRRPGDTALVSR